MQEKKKVCFLFRSSRNEAYSIEELFRSVKGYLSKNDTELTSRYCFTEQEVPNPSNSILNVIKNILFVLSLKGDIVHITGDIHYVLPFIPKNKKRILTIHDIVALQRTKKTSLKYWIIRYFWYVLPIKHADSITVISDKTKKDLLNLVSVDEKKINVITNFVKPIFKYSYKPNIQLENPNFLLIGGGVNKNTYRSILALSVIPGARVTLLGSFNKEVEILLKKNNITYTLFKNISHEQVVKLYTDCDVVLFPSLYEGFGMPIIEAQSVGRVVITSNISPMREIAGTGGCLVNPEQIDSIKEGILKVMGDDDYREQLIQAGLENVKNYSVDIVSKQYLRLYL